MFCSMVVAFALIMYVIPPMIVLLIIMVFLLRMMVKKYLRTAVELRRLT